MSYPFGPRPLSAAGRSVTALSAQLGALPPNHSKVLTVMDGGLRTRIEAAVEYPGALIHVESVPAVVRAVRERSVGAVLLSANAHPDHVRSVGRLVMRCAGMRAVAVTDDAHPPTQNELLYLGACGVSEVVNLSHPEGWMRLRQILADAGEELPARIFGFLDPVLIDASEETRRFFELIVRQAPKVSTVRALARTVGIHPGSFTSRFFRARLPYPKCFLAATRIIYVRALLEAPSASLADVAFQLRYSSPQSLGRHIRQNLGITATELRRDHSLAEIVALYITNLVVPHRQTWKTFDPFGQAVVLRNPDLPEHVIH